MIQIRAAGYATNDPAKGSEPYTADGHHALGNTPVFRLDNFTSLRILEILNEASDKVCSRSSGFFDNVAVCCCKAESIS